MIIDLHTHTKPWSGDSELEFPELIQQAKQAGLDAICLTEHDWFWDKNTLAKLSQEHDFLILPGVEISTEEGHILVFGVDKYSSGMYRAEYLKRIVDEAAGFMLLTHPYRGHLHTGDDLQAAVEQYCQEPIFQLLDTIEVLNGRSSEREKKFSQELCRKLNLKGVGSSDAHSSANISSCATLFERKVSNVEKLIAELKAGRFKAVDLRQGS